jgi:hypothetical protein
MQKKLASISAILGASVIAASANLITYVDVTTGNTTLANGGTFSPAPNGTTGTDHNWEQRPFGSSASIFESNGEVSNEDAPRLSVNLSLPNNTYDVYAYFWSPGTGDVNQQWLLRAGLVNTVEDLQLFSRPFGSTTSPTQEPGMGFATQVTDTSVFSVAPTVISESGRLLWQAYLGQAVVTSGTLQIFIDDYAFAGTVNRRTWLDGVGFAVPEPSMGAFAGLAVFGLLASRRQKNK